MDSDFCKFSLKKRFMKCKSINQDICYIFTGKPGAIQTIVKNFTGGKPYFEKISVEQLQEVTSVITDDDLNREDMEQLLRKELLLDEYKTKRTHLQFIHSSMLSDDDTVKTILTKICVYCTKEQITHPSLYVWYKDMNEINQSVGFKYQEGIRMDDRFSKDYEDMIDPRFVDARGGLIDVDNSDHLLHLFERYTDIQNNTLFFITAHEFATTINVGEITQQGIKNDMSVSRLCNGLLLKYWPSFKSRPEDFTKESPTYDKVKKYITAYSDGIRHMENVPVKQLKEVKCNNFHIQLLKINKPSSNENIIHLSKLFTEFALSLEYPFIKLVLETHEDTFYKLYKQSIVYEGFQRKKDTHVTKEICKRWSEDYSIKVTYGFEYLHSLGNIIIIKVYDEQYDKYCSLVLHMDGSTELIIDDIVIENEAHIVRLIKLSNSLLSILNKQTMYSFESIQLFDKDVLTNPYSDTVIEIMDCKIEFDRFTFVDKEQTILPNWKQGFRNYMENFPMFFRIKEDKEIEDVQEGKLISRFKRVSNYADMDKIHSRFSLVYTIDPHREPEVVIEEVSKIFSIDIEDARKEYDSWKEDLRMKQASDSEYTFNIRSVKEAGSEVIFSYDTDLIIEIKEIKSFVEYKRIVQFCFL